MNLDGSDPNRPARRHDPVLCSANQFLTIGLEYDYGDRTNRDASRLENHRLMFGMQLF